MRRTLYLTICMPLLAAGASIAVAPATAQGWHRGPATAQPHPAPIHGAAPGHVFAGGGFHAYGTVHPLLFQHHVFAHFTPGERAAWTDGWWHHGWWHGRWGWWWFAGGYWWWYSAPVYPYPTTVSDVYYVEPTYGAEDQGASGYWYYCSNPAGYYPYVQSCNGPWEPVPPTPAPGYGQMPNYQNDQGPGYQQGPPSGDEEGPPPGYPREQGPPPGDENGPPRGYPGEQGPPGDDQGGPPPGYPNEDGPPPNYGPGPEYNGNQGPPPGKEQGPPPAQEQGPASNDQGPPPPP